MEIATRFIALAPVKKSSKEKWLYALSLTPLERMRMTELCQRTTDETDSPFPDEFLREDITKEVKFDQSENKQYFYDMNASMDDTKRKRKGANNPFKEKRPKPEFDQCNYFRLFNNFKMIISIYVNMNPLIPQLMHAKLNKGNNNFSL